MFILPFIELVCKSFMRKKGRHAQAAEKGVQVRPAAFRGLDRVISLPMLFTGVALRAIIPLQTGDGRLRAAARRAFRISKHITEDPKEVQL